jgi:hypothetical protein
MKKQESGVRSQQSGAPAIGERSERLIPNPQTLTPNPAFLLLALLAFPAFAQQQPVPPHIGFLYPAGGRQGTTYEAIIGGQNLGGAYEVYLSDAGVQATVTRYFRPLTPAQAKTLREQMQELTQKQTRTPAEDATLADIRQKLQDFVRRPTSPAIAETVVLKVTIGEHAEPGARELRIGTSAGITNPILLKVGNLAEVTKEATKVQPAFNVNNGGTPPPRAIAARTAIAPVPVTLPTVINGQMMPGEIDRYRFHAAKGRRLTAAAEARELIPYLSDAVPGWFQATLTLRDPAGKQVAYADHFLFHPDPVLHYDVPADGDYTLEIHDSIFRGREDFVYRITLGEPPSVTATFPLNGKPGTRREKARKLKLPLTANGRILTPGQCDFFRFDAKAGEEIVAEVIARRLDSPLDSVLILTNSAGKLLAANDDFKDPAAGLLTHQADSRIQYKLPAKGTYYLQIGDIQHQAGPEYAYRLRVSHPEPDFELRVTPSSVNVRGGATVPFTVHAIRRDGFNGEIDLKLKNAPQNLTMTGGVIPADQDKVRLTLTAPAGPLDIPVPVQLEGRATVNGRELHHLAVPAEDMMQAFAYRHLVAQKAWMIRVIGAGAARPPVRAASEKPIKISAVGSAPLQVVVVPRLAGQVQLSLNEPPDGITIESVAPVNGGLAVTLRADPAKAKPGLKGNLILDAYVERPDAKTVVRRRQLLGTIPAIPFEIQ